MVRITENRLEPQGKERGLFNYLWDKVEFIPVHHFMIELNINSHFLLCDSQQVDLIVIGVTLNYERFQVVDLSVPWAFETYSFLIPVQNDTANINAVVKPFQWPVSYIITLLIYNT
jgi:ionotropic glutamate receptor